MKKLKLTLDDLEVSSFVAQESRGRAVHAMDSHQTQWGCMTWEGGCDPITWAYGCDPTDETLCLCTDAEGCYPSMYCSGGYPNETCVEGCMTNQNGAC